MIPDHRAWTELLRDNVKNGLVDYRALLSRRAELDSYLAGLEATDASYFRGLDDEHRLAFWINAYNAYSVSLILDHYPVRSIKDVTPFWKSPFKLRFIPLGHLHTSTTAGERISLEDIEHGLLRKRFDEPRVHFALVCASLGCPHLNPEAFTGERLDEQLDEAARTFLRDRFKNSYDASRNTLYLSPIFKWFGEDFGALGGPTGVFTLYADRPVVETLKSASSKTRIVFNDYDWTLNEKPYRHRGDAGSAPRGGRKR